MKEFKTCSASLLRRDRITAGLVGLVAFAVYALTMPSGLFIGESLQSIAQALGFTPSVQPLNMFQFWFSGLCIRGLSAAGLNIHLFAAVAGAVCAALLYRIAATFVYQNIHEEYCSQYDAQASLIAGLGVSVTFALSLAGWMASTCFSIYLVDLLMLLAVMMVLTGYVLNTAPGWLPAFALLYGMGMSQSAYFTLFSPLIALLVVLTMWRRSRLSLRRFSWVLVMFLVGMMVSFTLTAAVFSGSHDAALAGDKPLWVVIRQIVFGQLQVIRSLLPHHQWLLVLLTTSVPWVIAMFIAPRTMNNERLWSHYFLHTLMTVATVLAVLGLVLSPWQIYLPTGKFPLFSYAMVAVTTGYLLAYWFLMFKVRQADRSVVDANTSLFAFGRPVGAIFLVILGLAVAGSSAANALRRPELAEASFFETIADEVLDRLEGRGWFISDGTLDPHLKFRAKKRGIPVEVITLRDTRNPVHIAMVKEQVAPLFGEGDRQMMLNTLDLGVETFITWWFRNHAEFVQKNVVVWTHPDLWFGAAQEPIPEFVFFGAGLSWHGRDETTMLSEYETFLEKMDKLLPYTEKPSVPIEDFCNNLRRHVGLMGNNFGVRLADAGHEEDAYQFFKKLNAYDDNNISVLLNLYEIAGKSKNKEISAELEHLGAALDMWPETHPERYFIWGLPRHFGYVRNKELYRALIRVMNLGGDSAGAKTMAAKFLDPSDIILPEEEDRLEQSALQDIKNNPGDTKAYAALVNLYIRQGRAQDASATIRKAEAINLGMDFGLQRASILLAEGKADDARALLQSLVESNPRNYSAQGMLGFIMIDQGDFASVQRHILDRIEREVGNRKNYFYQIVLARMCEKQAHKALEEDDPATWRQKATAARDAYQLAARERPEVKELRTTVLEYDFRLNDKVNARKTAQDILRRDMEDSLANYILGSIRFSEGDYGAAETYLRRSVTAKEDVRALNDYAEVLRRIKKTDLALEYAQKAVEVARKEKSPFTFTTLDTLAMTLVEKNRFAEAKTASDESIRLEKDVRDAGSKDKANVHLLLTQLTIAIGLNNPGEARRIAAEIRGDLSDLDDFEKRELQRLEEELSKM